MPSRVHVFVLLVVLAGLTLVLAVPRPITKACTKMGNDPCRCKMDDSDEIIDLTPLDSGNYLEPMFKDVPVNATYINSTDLYSWNPCTPFCEVHCEGAATCQHFEDSVNNYFTIGKHNTTNFTVDLISPYYNSTNLMITYSYAQDGVDRTSVISLLCDKEAINDTFIAYGEIEPKKMFYYFEIISKHVCPQKQASTTAAPLPTQPSCPHPWTTTTLEQTTTPTTTVTTEPPTTPYNPSLWDLGWKLWVAIGCLSVVVLALLYFVIGLSVNLIRGRRGMAVVPHYLCWVAMCPCCKCCTSFRRKDHKRLLKEYDDDRS